MLVGNEEVELVDEVNPNVDSDVAVLIEEIVESEEDDEVELSPPSPPDKEDSDKLVAVLGVELLVDPVLLVLDENVLELDELKEDEGL